MTRAISVTIWSVTIWVGLVLTGCQSAETPDPVGGLPPALADKSHYTDEAAWAREVIPLMWGRIALSSAEVAALADVTRALGRAETIRRMARSPEFVAHWTELLFDHMNVPRTNPGARPACYGQAQNPGVPGPELAAHVRENEPAAAFGSGWTMVDLAGSALNLGDISPLYRLQLFLLPLTEDEPINALASQTFRLIRAQMFMKTYTNREMACLKCHNSEASVTDSPDPIADQTWGTEGHFEKALFGDSAGRDMRDLGVLFRAIGVIGGFYYYPLDDPPHLKELWQKSLAPWGTSPHCGAVVPPSQLLADDIESGEAYLGKALGTKASVWDVEALFTSGVASLRTNGLALNDDKSVAPDVALAWLWAGSVADFVWEEATGYPLTVAHFFPRNQAQGQLLADLTHRFVESGYSLSELLVSVATAPDFMRAPTQDYQALFDPWADDELPQAERTNNIDHVLVPRRPRVLLRSVFDAMEWPIPPAYPFHYADSAGRILADVGVFLRETIPGGAQTGVQAGLLWERHFGVCTNPFHTALCPVERVFYELPLHEDLICDVCLGRDDACVYAPACCAVDWEAICPTECATGLPGYLDINLWPPFPIPLDQDWLSSLVASMSAQNKTVEDAVRALRDRLFADPGLADPAERTALEALLGRSLSDPMTADAEGPLRMACGAMMTAPQFQLRGYSGANMASNEVLLPTGNENAICQLLGKRLVGDSGFECTSGRMTLSPQP